MNEGMMVIFALIFIILILTAMAADIRHRKLAPEVEMDKKLKIIEPYLNENLEALEKHPLFHLVKPCLRIKKISDYAFSIDYRNSSDYRTLGFHLTYNYYGERKRIHLEKSNRHSDYRSICSIPIDYKTLKDARINYCFLLIELLNLYVELHNSTQENKVNRFTFLNRVK